MSGVRDLKRRIVSVKNTLQITKAMKVVAAAKLQRTQGAVLASRPYAGKLEEVLDRIAASNQEYSHPLMEVRPVKKAGIILITSDRGLAGGYNSIIIKKAIAESVRLQPAEVSFISVGRKGHNYLKRRGKQIIGSFLGLNDVPTFQEAKQIAKLARELFTDKVLDELYLVYQEYVSAVQQRPAIKKLLPISYKLEAQETRPEEQQVDYLYEPGPEKILDILVPKYVNYQLFEVLREAKASEFGGQMVAMTAATENAQKIIDQLTLSFNRARQAAITKEISEIIGGAKGIK